MKFTHGFWRMRPGVQAYHPVQVHDIEIAQASFTAYAPTKRIQGRGDLIDSPLLTIALSSPMPDVIRVKITHLAGAQPRPPQFALNQPGSETAGVVADSRFAALTSGQLSARLWRGEPFRLEFVAAERVITSSGPRSLGFIEQEGAHYMIEQLSLGVGENVYGLGEHFTPFVKNGQSVEMWNEDGGASTELAYKNIPFYLTNRGYGVFVSHPGKVAFEVASEKVSRVQFSVEDQSLEYFVIYGPTPKEVLEKYTALTGRPALPPPWSFGLWLSTSFTTSSNEATVTSMIQGMADRGLPLHVFHFDCFWMQEYHWCSFEWDGRVFPDPAAMLQRLKQRGLHICVWINPYIAQRSPLFEEGRQGGFLLKKPNGDVWQSDLWQPGMAIVDFTNPAARQWYCHHLRQLLDMGVDCFKTDFGERIPVDVVYHDGSDPHKMHNFYTYLYNQTVFEALKERRGEGEAVLFARSATAGGQQFPVHWGGDNESTFVSMAESLRGGLSLGLSGFGFWSHDIGGFEGTPPADVYKRWIAFGLLSSHSRLHGSASYRVPWLYDQEAVQVLQSFTRLKCRLMPYLYAHAVQAHARGLPLMRAMLLEFPADPACACLDRQYMLGEALLVAPVFSADGLVEYYLPAGRWTNFFTGEVIEGPGWRHEQHDFLSLPLMVRPDSILPLGSQEDRPDYDYCDGLTLQIYQLSPGHTAAVSIPDRTGRTQATAEARRNGQEVAIDWQGPDGNWKALLVGISEIASVEGGQAEKTAQGVLLTPAAGSHHLMIWTHRDEHPGRASPGVR